MDASGFGGCGCFDGGDAGASRLEDLRQQGTRSLLHGAGRDQNRCRHLQGAYAGPRQTIVYRSVENNIEYRVTVMSFIQAQAEGATILGEREYMFQDGKGK
jgi:hypothetical protein